MKHMSPSLLYKLEIYANQLFKIISTDQLTLSPFNILKIFKSNELFESIVNLMLTKDQ